MPLDLISILAGTSIRCHCQPVRIDLLHRGTHCNFLMYSIDVFLQRFSTTAYFFLDPSAFRKSALLPLPFGDENRPSPALLSVVYLWGSLLTDSAPDVPFLACTLQNMAQDLVWINPRPTLVLDTIQAEVLLSLYYLHTAQPVPGRYHSATATSIALCARLHLIGSTDHSDAPYLPYPLPQSLETHSVEAAGEGHRIHAFWAVVTLSNYWVAVDGGPSSISPAIISTPWSLISPASVSVDFWGRE